MSKKNEQSPKKGIQPIKTIPQNREESSSDVGVLRGLMIKWLQQLRALYRLYALRGQSIGLSIDLRIGRLIGLVFRPKYFCLFQRRPGMRLLLIDPHIIDIEMVRK